MKMQCRTDSITMVNVIVTNVMSFVTDTNDSNCVVDGWGDEDADDEDNESYYPYHDPHDSGDDDNDYDDSEGDGEGEGDEDN